MFEKNVDKTRVVTVRKAFWGVDTLVAVGTKMLNPPVKGGCWFTFNDKINQSSCVDCRVLQKTVTDLLNAALPVALQSAASADHLGST